VDFILLAKLCGNKYSAIIVIRSVQNFLYNVLQVIPNCNF
jgi:hypothetical protein